ncbi:MAG TPA: hypothetical protein VFD60_12365 [Nitrososphaeraceae archaeon]|jgi:hypothetical protein|nr:hypothetical protein [Nitrososphaeraceae archaeon]
MIDQRRITLLPAVAIIALLIASFSAVTIQFGQKASAQSSSSNPLAKVPVIGKLMSTGGANSTNSTSTSANNSSKNTTSTSQSSNPLAKVPVIGKLFGSK